MEGRFPVWFRQVPLAIPAVPVSLGISWREKSLQYVCMRLSKGGSEGSKSSGCC